MSKSTALKNFIELDITKLVKADWNYKKDDPEKKEKLKANIMRNGQIENIIVRELETGFYEIVNGNHRYDALLELNFIKIVAYNCGKITLPQAQRIAIETNETRFESDLDKLGSLLQEIKLEVDEEDLKLPMPFSDEEFQELLDSVMQDVVSITDTSEIEEDNFDTTPPPVPVSKSYDLYELISGGLIHRLYCGDSTKPEDVATLMNGKKADLLHTDPPYNVKYAEFNLQRGENGKNCTDEYCSDWQDDMSDEDYKRFLIDFIRNAKQHLIDWAHYYVWHATSYYREVLDAFEANSIPYDKVPIQWVKQVAPISWVRYKRKSEPCIFAGKGAVNGNGEGARWFGPHNEVNIWDIDRDHNVNYVHPTQKPLALAARAIRNSSRAGEYVLDLFMGSGTTLITSDMMGRNSFGMEMEPKFCDVIVTRFANYKISKNQDFKILRNGEDCTEEVKAMLIDSKKIIEKEIAQEA